MDDIFMENAAIDNSVTCLRCGDTQPRPAYLTTSNFAECPFVCENCRCKDCSIVLGFECECGERHAERSPSNPQICLECANIRQRIEALDIISLKDRNSEIADEGPIDTVSSVRKSRKRI